MGHEDHYIVRGAPIRCECGSHIRRIDLPRSHGSYTQKQPMMTWIDRVPLKNIPSFGICSSGISSPDARTALSLGKGPIVVSRVNDIQTYYDENGDAFTGCSCIPETANHWSNPEYKLLIRNECALVFESYLYCAYGGRIVFVSSGQNFVW